ncbi:MAG TPA: hypothetical protein PLM74_00335 [Bacillota bacterium]|jgi:hypothetical protein|nr:hypothetical protein [Bacillota bacterium]
MKMTCTTLQRSWWTIAAPTAVCIMTTGYAALTAPTWWVVAVAFASAALCAAGAAAGDFGIVGWSGAAATGACAASLVENRPIHWGEPTLMCIGVLAMLEIGHIVCIIRTREVNPSVFVHAHADADKDTPKDADNGNVDHNETLIALLPSVALRLAASGAASLGLTRLYLASAISGALRDSDTLFMMLLGAVAVGACMYWLVRISIQDFRR